MPRKGKFQLLSYLIDENLIYYKSLNRNKKIIAFTMFESIHIKSIISNLNQFLKKRLIKYYTIQLNTLDNNRKIFLLNFEEIKKDSIVKIFNEVKRGLVENNHHLTFFKNSNLEWKFLEPIVKKPSSKISLVKQNKSILFSNGNKAFLLNVYSVNLDYLDNLDSFISSFLKLVNSFNRNGYLIFNFKIDSNDQIIFSPLYSEKYKTDDESFNTENSVNTFFNYNILKLHDIKPNQIFSYLWRIGIFNDFVSLDYFNKLFIEKDQDDLRILLAFNKEFEQNLLKNKITFIRLGKNLLLVEDKFLFLGMIDLNSEYIHKIIKKFHSKFFIFITILSENGLKKLLEIPEFKSLQNLKVLSQNDIKNFNFKVLINNGRLKDS